MQLMPLKTHVMYGNIVFSILKTYNIFIKEAGHRMCNILRLLACSGKKEKVYLRISYIINITFIGVMLMFGFGMSNTTNLTLHDAEQAEIILSSMIIVSIIVIIFFQWLTGMQFVSLFESRKVFNQNIRLLGLSSGKLTLLYFLEMLKMQLIAIPAGFCCAEIIYVCYAGVSGAAEHVIPVLVLFEAAGIHLAILCVMTFMVGTKCAGTNIVELLRGKKIFQRRRKGLKSIRLLEFLAGKISAKYRRYKFWIMLKISNAQRKNIRIIRFLVLGSVVLICGLYGLYTTVRTLAYQRTNEQIQYAGYVWLDEPVESISILDSYQTLSFKAWLSEDSRIRITGIDQNYVGTYENIELAYALNHETVSDWLEHLNEDDFDGIILDTEYIDESDLGETVTYEIDGKTVSFTVYGGYVSNNLAEFNGYVSPKYLEKQLGLDGYWNRAYVLSAEAMNDVLSKTASAGIYDQATKKELCEKSYEHAVQGTGEIELVCWMITICAMLASATCIYMIREKNESIVSRFISIGMEKRQIQTMYVLLICWIVIPVLVPAILLSILFQKLTCALALSSQILVGVQYRFPIPLCVVVCVLFVLTMIMIQLSSIRKMFQREEFVRYIRRNESTGG
jgi:hypothetical protein